MSIEDCVRASGKFWNAGYIEDEPPACFVDARSQFEQSITVTFDDNKDGNDSTDPLVMPHADNNLSGEVWFSGFPMAKKMDVFKSLERNKDKVALTPVFADENVPFHGELIMMEDGNSKTTNWAMAITLGAAVMEPDRAPTCGRNCVLLHSSNGEDIRCFVNSQQLKDASANFIATFVKPEDQEAAFQLWRRSYDEGNLLKPRPKIYYHGLNPAGWPLFIMELELAERINKRNPVDEAMAVGKLRELLNEWAPNR